MTPRESRYVEISAAIAPLLGHPNFENFVQLIRQMREQAIEDACTDSVVADERASMAAIGEIRTYKAILDTYDQARAVPVEKAEPDA